MRSRSSWIRALLLTSLLLATAANAATVSIVSDAASYGVGATITLTVFTNSQGESLFTATAFVAYTGGPVTPLTQNQVVPAGGWVTSPALDSLSSPGFKAAFDTLNLTGGDPGTGISSTVTFRVDGVGETTFTIGGNPNNGIAFDFGTASPGASVTVFHGGRIPEPATAALVAFGLIGFGLRSRRH